MVTIDRNKKELKVNEPVEVTVDLKFDNLDISNDTIVDFEIVKNGVQVDKGNSEYVGDGKYIIKTMFSSPGQQQLVAHVYYEWFHEMPTLSFDVK
ncbi:hypothetical protein B1NLA3E_09635 [Bacillus sp. 1NLA3E]|nr:hypothetical protein B1NLA3E_09635 [Bacillus sp. 1NLA3E]